MSDPFWLTDAQMACLEPYFPKSRGKQRVDDRRVLSEIIFINRNGLRWRDAPNDYGPHKTLYNRWKRWSDKGIFAQMMAGLAADQGEEKTVICDPDRLLPCADILSDGILGPTASGMTKTGYAFAICNVIIAVCTGTAGNGCEAQCGACAPCNVVICT